jgi:hypothetical protein
MRKVLGVILMGAFLIPNVSQAAKGSSVINDVGTDSCGLGWQITNKKSFLATTTRGTTNAFVPPTFGMTFGTIGCDKHSFAKNEEAGVTFALANHENLVIEMAQGKGEYLSGFARALGCDDSNTFGQMAQSHYTRIVTEQSSPIELYKNVKSEISRDPILSLNCRA